MRVVQYKILTELLEKVQVPNYIHAFEKGRNIPAMAEMHVGKKVVISVDLKDYFTSIKQYHLEQLFIHLGFGVKPARVLSEVCTYKSFVPQGALTSPKLSNLITAFTFGPIIKQYCDSKGLILSIYADDITISSDIEIPSTGGDSVTALITYLRATVERFGFKVNSKKTKVMKYYQRQYVCGAVVNSKVNLQKSERHTLRAIVHNCEKNGIDKEAIQYGVSRDKFISIINGRLNWFNQLNPVAGTRVIDKFKKIYGQEQTTACNSPTGEVETGCSSDSQTVALTIPQFFEGATASLS
jgi:RNA-directed DNA polymerase